MGSLSPYKLNETFSNVTFDESFNVKNYHNCVFDNCVFKDGPIMNTQVFELFSGSNKLVNCWFNPVPILNKLLTSLNQDVNLIDALNKALIKTNGDKQIVLIDIGEGK